MESQEQERSITYREEPVICKYTALGIAQEAETRRRLLAAASLEEDTTENHISFDGSEFD